jgi:glycosyltransferase involved in cell wall biosynthesis
MNNDFLVSVVMAVFNGADTLRETLDSVLQQEQVNLEFIVVNDGSTDESLDILKECEAADHRLKVLDQGNQGLVRSLIRGCEHAKGEYIARQDAGDTSLPGRLAKEAAVLREDAHAALASCGTRYVGPGGESVYEVLQSDAEADAGLRTLDVKKTRGPSSHGSAMFRRRDYIAVGGYRHCFQVAQDLDLWLRLAERGKHRSVREILYLARLLPGGISSTKRSLQIQTAKLILQAARNRREGHSEKLVLEQSAQLRASAHRHRRRFQNASYYYFVASCIRDRDPGRSRRYFMKAIGYNPFHLKAIIRLLQTTIRPQQMSRSAS